MPLTTLSADNLLDTWGTTYGKFMSLHSAYSASGASELTGGSPAYARLATTWSAAAGNSKALASTPYNFNAPAGSTVGWIGFWDALTSGNFQGMFPAGNTPAFAFAAPSATSTLLAPGSSFASNTQVVVAPTGGSSLPSGLVTGTIYFIKSPSSDSFQLSATSGPGSAVTLSSDGAGIVQAIVVQTFAVAGTYPVSGSSVSLV